jgi:Domain of unknown function (DUF4272)
VTGSPESPHGNPLENRRRRTSKYLNMWGVSAELDAVPVVTEDEWGLASVETIRGRALACCVLALRGQGLSQIEAFAFADAYQVWPHFTLEEDQFILTEEPTGNELLQFAWLYERLWVHLWTLGVVRHLAFADTPVETATALELCISAVALLPAEALSVRDIKAVLDAADVARAEHAISQAADVQGLATALHPGIVFERSQAFGEVLVPR